MRSAGRDTSAALLRRILPHSLSLSQPFDMHAAGTSPREGADGPAHEACRLLDAQGAGRRSGVGRALRSYEAVTSTNDLALAWAAAGAPHGAVAYAERQTKGRGRMGRAWVARSGRNLTFSVVLRPTLPPDRWNLITIAACVAAAEAIDGVAAPLRTQIKWPNDILIDDRKCCGMLLESAGAGQPSVAARAVVLGVGVNVNEDTLPPEIEGQATSLLLATGRPVRRAHLLVALFDRIDQALRLLEENPLDILKKYMNRMYNLNAPAELRFAHGQGTVQGIVAGLGETGGLLLATDEGVQTFHAGEVTAVR